MRSVSLGLLAILAFVSTGFTQIKTSDKAVIKTPAVRTEGCKERVEFYISKEYGVTSVKVDIKRNTTSVSWLTDRTTLENIKVAIANLGFDADDIEAEEFAYKRLPKECKRPDEKPKATPVSNEQLKDLVEWSLYN